MLLSLTGKLDEGEKTSRFSHKFCEFRTGVVNRLVFGNEKTMNTRNVSLRPLRVSLTQHCNKFHNKYVGRGINFWMSNVYEDGILHESVSARWVPRLLTPDNKSNRDINSEQCLTLTLFKRNPKEFLRRFVTVDETWIHWYAPQTKENQNSGLHRAKVLRRRRRLSYRPERLWPPFSGIHKVWSTSTAWRRAKRSRSSTMPNYWSDSTSNCRKNGSI